MTHILPTQKDAASNLGRFSGVVALGLLNLVPAVKGSLLLQGFAFTIVASLILALGRYSTGWPGGTGQRVVEMPVRGSDGGDWAVTLVAPPPEPMNIVAYLVSQHNVRPIAASGSLITAPLPVRLGESMSHDEANRLADDLHRLGANVSVMATGE